MSLKHVCGAKKTKGGGTCSQTVAQAGDRCRYHKAVAHRCGAQKARGGTCKLPVSAEGVRCSYHDTDKQPYADHKLDREGPQLPKDVLDLVEDDAIAARTLRVKLDTAHTAVKTDRPGWIYVYYLEGDDAATYFKIGRTAKTTPQARIEEWPGAVLRYAVRMPFNKLGEAVVHALLDRWRLLRYVFDAPDGGTGQSGKRFLTAWRSDGVLLRDAAYDTVRSAKDGPPAPYSKYVWEQLRSSPAPEKLSFGTRTKEVEWFNSSFSRIRYVIDQVAMALVAWCKDNKKINNK